MMIPPRIPPPVPPVVDPRHDQPEQEETDHPSPDLLENRLAVEPPPALAVVEKRTDQCTDGARCADGVTGAGQIGNYIAGHPAEGIDGKHSPGTVFARHQRSNLPQGHHVEEDVQQAAVEVVSRQERPEPAEPVDGDHAGGPQEQQAVAPRRQGRKEPTLARRTVVDQQRCHIHDDIDGQNDGDDPVRIAGAPGEGVVFQPRTGAGGAAVGAGRLIAVDEAATVGAEYRAALGSCHSWTSLWDGSSRGAARVPGPTPKGYEHVRIVP